jgi:hypothetical protein
MALAGLPGLFGLIRASAAAMTGAGYFTQRPPQPASPEPEQGNMLAKTFRSHQ